MRILLRNLQFISSAILTIPQKLPQSAALPALSRHAYVCRRHYSGALTLGFYNPSTTDVVPLPLHRGGFGLCR